MMIISHDAIKEIGIDWILDKINVNGYYGSKHLKGLKAFSPDNLTDLIIEYDMVDEFLRYLRSLEVSVVSNIKRCFKNLRNIDGYISIVESGAILGTADIFAIKEFVRNLIELEGFVEKYSERVYDFKLEDFKELWILLNPIDGDPHTFRIYDSYSEKLSKLRKMLKAKKLVHKSESERIKVYIKENLGIDMTLKDEVRIKKSNKELIMKIGESNFLKLNNENYMYLIYGLRETDILCSIKKEIENIKLQLELEEGHIRERLTKEIKIYVHNLINMTSKIGYLDFTLGKAEFILENKCVRPSISSCNNIRIDEGINLKLKDTLEKSQKNITPVSIDVREGVNLITGANMGGKTVSLRTVAMLTIMAQMGIYVPAKNFEYYPVDFLIASIGDKQSQELGLSSFGAEMDIVSKAISMSDKNGLILLDELASGTNPSEGYAISKAIMNHFKSKGCKLLITSHYDGFQRDLDVNHYEVSGLRHVDFDNLKFDKPLHELMDYSLVKGNRSDESPMEAINIAKFMGIDREIIKNARKILKNKN